MFNKEKGQNLENYNKEEKQQQKEKKNKAKVKEINFNVRTEKHDVDVKVKKIKELLEKGWKVRTNVNFQGREVERPELGNSMMTRILEMVGNLGKYDKPPALNGKTITVELRPGKIERN